MSDVVIRSEGLGKKYVIGHEAAGERYTSLRDTIAQQVRRFAHSAVDMARGRPLVVGETREEFWALRDVNFEIRRGEVVGIIGRNGAGKSTLLKILSRITEPTEGRVTIDGRVASLLEVGTGFHPELSGRENIFLNGAILGMTRAEIRRKFDEIVAFAGVEKFIDTPVKRYSSGMYVRLAFSVAAHLEPEILVVDEVLAVGDAEFQKKSLGKMQDVAGQGRTVLFVSHNMGAVSTLCKRGILLQDGKIKKDSDTAEAVDSYYSFGKSSIEAQLRSCDARRGAKAEIFSSLKIQDEKFPSVFTGGALSVSVSLDLNNVPEYVRQKPEINIAICDSFGRRVLTLMSIRQGLSDLKFGKGEYAIKASVEKIPLSPGRYFVELRFWTPGEQWDEVSPALSFDVIWPLDHSGPTNWSTDLGCLYLQPTWTVSDKLTNYEGPTTQ